MLFCRIQHPRTYVARGLAIGLPTLIVTHVDTIVISDLEACFRIGVTDAERHYPQRLLLTVEMWNDFSAAVATDSIETTVDYFAVSQALLKFGEGKQWRLIEKLAADIAKMILKDFQPAAVSVEVKKFVVPQAQFVAVRLTRERRSGSTESHPTRYPRHD